MQEAFDWLKPSPFWAPNGADLSQGTFYRPAILDYATDDFVEAFLAEAGAPSADSLARRALRNSSEEPFKLYQPAHGRFYLLCATLSCRQPGLPDREVRLAEKESTYYVLRRVTGNGEYGWIAEGAQAGWQPVGPNPRVVLTGEERQPMFRAPTGTQRELRYAYIPTTSRDSGLGDLSDLPAEVIETVIGEPPPPDDLRLFALESRFLAQVQPSSGTSPLLEADAANAQRLSIYLLLDLLDYVDTFLPATAQHLAGDTTVAITAAESALLTFLASTAALSGTTSLRVLLENVAAHRVTLDELGEEELPAPFDGAAYNLAGRTLDEAQWESTVHAALTSVDAATGRTKPQSSLPQIQPESGEQYLIRCVYERPQCEKVKAWVSHPTEHFSLAPLYDPDAPARSINIALPSDLSLGSLRKFQKGATFIMSQALRDKLKQIPLIKMTDDDADVSGLSLSYICSFSIPIITICAFILLLIIVIVLNFVFWWLPFLKICFPIPKAAE
ncbi:MAG: hypothetical protein KDE53_12030 [Caldilineaceae bacterium]|nr:hypothetical protein [Caldilineaceae bacterium]